MSSMCPGTWCLQASDGDDNGDSEDKDNDEDEDVQGGDEDYDDDKEKDVDDDGDLLSGWPIIIHQLPFILKVRLPDDIWFCIWISSL